MILFTEYGDTMRYLQRTLGAAVEDTDRGDERIVGPGAARLHDELIAVAAPWHESGEGDHLRPTGSQDDRQAVTNLEELLGRAAGLPAIPEPRRQRLAKTAAADFAALWRHVRDEADGRAHEAGQLLQARGAKEAEDLHDEIRDEPAELEALYQVSLKRLVPVGLVYLWPTTSI